MTKSQTVYFKYQPHPLYLTPYILGHWLAKVLD